MTYELAEEILPFCKNCVEELKIVMKQTQAYDEKTIEECIDLSIIDSNLIYKKVGLFSYILLSVGIFLNTFKLIINNYT